MIAARDRLAIASLTTALTGEFDLPTALDTAAHDARAGFDAVSAAVIVLGASVGALVVHNGRRRSDTSETVQTLVQGTVAISTATASSPPTTMDPTASPRPGGLRRPHFRPTRRG